MPFCDMVSDFIAAVRISTPGGMVLGASLTDFERLDFLSPAEAGVRDGLSSDSRFLSFTPVGDKVRLREPRHTFARLIGRSPVKH